MFDVLKSSQLFACVVTVCDESNAEKCPIFPGPTKRLHWSFPDPSQVTGSKKEKLERQKEVRWAIVRLIFGLLQIADAAASLILLLQSAPMWLTAATVGVTLLFTGVSRILFSRPTASKGK